MNWVNFHTQKKKNTATYHSTNSEMINRNNSIRTKYMRMFIIFKLYWLIKTKSTKKVVVTLKSKIQVTGNVNILYQKNEINFFSFRENIYTVIQFCWNQHWFYKQDVLNNSVYLYNMHNNCFFKYSVSPKREKQHLDVTLHYFRQEVHQLYQPLAHSRQMTPIRWCTICIIPTWIMTLKSKPFQKVQPDI